MWRIGIKHPRAENKVVTVLPVADMAVSTRMELHIRSLDAVNSSITDIALMERNRPCD